MPPPHCSVPLLTALTPSSTLFDTKMKENPVIHDLSMNV